MKNSNSSIAAVNTAVEEIDRMQGEVLSMLDELELEYSSN